MGGKSKPKAPDYRGAAEETARANMEALEYQTQANRPRQITPFGETNWVQDADGNWTQTTTLAPASQRAVDAQLGLTADRSELASGLYGRVENEFADPMDWSALPEVTGGAMARQRAEDAIYGRSTSRLDPQWEQRESDMQAQLVAQGLRPGDPAYERAMENMARDRTDAYQQAQYGAIMGGGQEASRQYALESTERNRQLAEEMQKRGFSLNEINAIISGQQVGLPQMPGFQAAGRGQGPNYLGAAQAQGQFDMNRYSADQALRQGLYTGIAGLGMMGIG